MLVRHEQSAAHAADGYARMTGKPGVCVATSGPGATNLVTGIMGAKADSVPLVAITGQVARAAMGTEAFQECDICSIASVCTKRTYLVMSASDLARTIQEAFRVAQEGRPGPVLIDVPRDVQLEEAEFEYPESAWVPDPQFVRRDTGERAQGGGPDQPGGKAGDHRRARDRELPGRSTSCWRWRKGPAFR